MTTVFQRVRVGPYEIGHEVGRGGMAVVFVATDSRDGRCVALKLVPAATNRDAQEVLAAERWGAKLQEQFCRVSQHVPVVYEHGTEGGYFYIAMEYIDGQNLSEVLAAGALTPGRAVNIAIQLCHFLEAAHSFESTIDGRNLRSLLHGDLKPRNIRVLRADKVKVLDFGIAKALSLSRHATRNNFGSITYVSPERLESGEIDAYADYWSVGVLLYEMLSGVQPFRGPDTLFGGPGSDVFGFAGGGASYETHPGWANAFRLDEVADYDDGVDHVHIEAGIPLTIIQLGAAASVEAASLAATPMLNGAANIADNYRDIAVAQIGSDVIFLFWGYGIGMEGVRIDHLDVSQFTVADFV